MRAIVSNPLLQATMSGVRCSYHIETENTVKFNNIITQLFLDALWFLKSLEYYFVDFICISFGL